MIEFHQTHKRHKDLINRGVSHNLSEFISALDAINEAFIFFEDNQPECPDINQLGFGFCLRGWRVSNGDLSFCGNLRRLAHRSKTWKLTLSQLFNVGRFKIEDSFIKNLSNGSKIPAPEVLLESSQ